MVHNSMFTDEESRWSALTMRDRSAEDAFYYAVKTTGVFCRPSCSSRLPKRENVEFFDSCEEAELAGYRPCKRCKPGTTSPRQRLVALVVQACRHIEETETSSVLDQLTAEAGLSPWHFHRLFKEVIGVTPEAICCHSTGTTVSEWSQFRTERHGGYLRRRLQFEQPRL